jgi:hypothetical protein
MNWNISRSLASGYILLVLSAKVCAMDGIDQPAFQGAAAPRPASGGLGTSDFDIDLVYFNAPTPGEAAAFSAAEAKWESLITGYQIADIFSTTVTINVFLNPIDGAGGILGSAGPTFAKLNAAQNAVTPNFLYTDEGDMEFDTADTEALVGLGLFDEVILHEMGHVLGIGILWSSSSVGFPGRQEHYVFNSGQYTGPAGLAAYNDEFGQAGAFVPVELGGGAGTRNAHWNEVNGGGAPTGISSNMEAGPFNDMAFELMTGWLNPPQAFLSSLTSQSMIDLGYTVVPEPSTRLLGSCVMLFFACRLRT